MTKEEQRIAIAEKCGWNWKWKDSQQLVRCWGMPGDTKYYDSSVPNYPNDLNAMHDAEEVIRKNQFHFVSYPETLFKVVTGKLWDGNMGYFMFNFATSTAEQRAEAFCRTFWPEQFKS